MKNAVVRVGRVTIIAAYIVLQCLASICAAQNFNVFNPPSKYYSLTGASRYTSTVVVCTGSGDAAFFDAASDGAFVKFTVQGSGACMLDFGDESSNIAAAYGTSNSGVMAYSTRNGSALWKNSDFQSTVVMPAVAYHAGSVYLIHGDSANIACLDAKTGDKLWVKAWPDGALIPNLVTPLLAGNTLIYSAGGLAGLSLSGDHGKLWTKKEFDVFVYSSKMFAEASMVHNDDVYAMSWGQSPAFHKFSAVNGKNLWSAGGIIGQRIPSSITPLGPYFGQTGDGKVFFYNGTNVVGYTARGEFLFETKQLPPYGGGILVAKRGTGCLFSMKDGVALDAFGLPTGTYRGEVKLPSGKNINCGVAVKGKHVFLTDAGTIVTMDDSYCPS